MAIREIPRAGSAGFVDVRLEGSGGTVERDCATALIGAVLSHHDVSADGARVRLTCPRRAAGAALVQVNLRVCGALARVQVAGATVAEAIAAGAARLHRQIRRLTRRWEQWPWPDPERPPLAMASPAPIARTKSYRLQVGTVCQAAAVMNALDYDVHLFTDAETGEDAVVYRAGPTGFRLARQRSMHPPARSGSLELTVSPHRVPALTPAQAAGRLAWACSPFVFFSNAESGRANVVYRRYDGRATLLVPAGTASPVSASKK